MWGDKRVPGRAAASGDERGGRATRRTGRESRRSRLLRPVGGGPDDRARARRRPHLRLLHPHVAQPDRGSVRRDRRPLVGGLHRRLDPVQADRAAARPDAGRARPRRRSVRRRPANRRRDPVRRLPAHGRRAADRPRPPPGAPVQQRPELLLGDARRADRVLAGLLRARLPRRTRSLRGLRGAADGRDAAPPRLRDLRHGRHLRRPGADRPRRRPGAVLRPLDGPVRVAWRQLDPARPGRSPGART